MIIVSLIFLTLCFCSTKIKKSFFSKELYLEGYSINNTTALRGILALGIVLCHITAQVDYQLPGISLSVMGSVGVGIFFFLSGYSLIVSSNNPQYFVSFLKKRGIKIVIPFSGMMVLWIIIVCGGIGEPLENIIKSFIHGHPVSNSWYIFACLYCYFLFWLAFYKFNKNKKIKCGIFIIVVGSIIYICVTAFVFKWGNWWYKTIECFLVGIIWGICFKDIKEYIKKKYITILFALLCFSGVSYLFPNICRRIFQLQGNWVWIINDVLMAFSFTLLIAVLLYKINICNKTTLFLGNISYEIYLFHGLVMAILDSFGGKQFWNQHMEQEIYALLVFIITIVVATIFHKMNKSVVSRVLKSTL